MAFTLQPKPTFQAEVTIPTPNGDGKVTFEFKHMGRKALAAFYDSATKPENGRPEGELFLDMIAGWSGVDEKFSPENLQIFLDNYMAAPGAIFDAYNQALLKGKEKNS